MLSHQSAGQVSEQSCFFIATRNNLPGTNTYHPVAPGEPSINPLLRYENCVPKRHRCQCVLAGSVISAFLLSNCSSERQHFPIKHIQSFVKVCHSLPKWCFQRTTCLNNRKILYLEEKLPLQMHVRDVTTVVRRACIYYWYKKCVRKAMSVHPSSQQVKSRWESNSSSWFRNVLPCFRWLVTEDSTWQVLICNFKLIEYFTSNCIKYKKE